MARIPLARPTSISLNEKNGNALVERSISVSSESTLRARGPENTETPQTIIKQIQYAGKGKRYILEMHNLFQ